MNWPTVYKFSRQEDGLWEEVVFDTGWNEMNQCEGNGSYQGLIEFVNGAVVLQLRALGSPNDTVVITLNDTRMFFDVSLPVNSSVFACRMEDGVIIIEATDHAIFLIKQGVLRVSRGY